jgi:diacylglycerol kinase family enzyme
VLPLERRRAHYLATANGTPFLACASVGPDSAAVTALSEPLKRVIGRLAYVVAFLGVLWRWPRPKLRLRAVGIDLPCEAVFVAKGRYYAGPWSFAPAARLDAQRVHVVAIEHLTRWNFLRFMVFLLLHRPLAGRQGFACFETDSLNIECATGAPLQADGDAAGACPATIAVLPAPTVFARAAPIQ